MNSQTKTLKQITKEHKILGHAMLFGDWVIATNRIWNDQRAAYDHFATLYKRTDTDHAIHMTDSDEAFTDEGHATAWAIGMATTYDDQVSRWTPNLGHHNRSPKGIALVVEGGKQAAPVH